jgi:hypothetical protein
MIERPHNLNDWPLWRLIVEMHDAERCYGPSSPTVKLLARLIQERLSGNIESPLGRGVSRVE